MGSLDVLVIESHAGTASRHVDALEAAGHHVHRCQHAGADPFPCIEITDPGSCPIDAGVDVALLVRRNITPRPTDGEHGVSCAIRSGIPVVEDGPVVLDPFEEFVTARVGHDLVPTCVDAAEKGYEAIRATIVERCASLFAAAGVDVSAGGIEFRRTGTRLAVTVRGQPISNTLRDSLAVRVTGVVNEGARTHEGVDVSYVAVADDQDRR